MTDDATDADRRHLLAELRERRRRVEALLAAEDFGEAKAARPPAGSSDAAKQEFWTRRFAALSPPSEGETPMHDTLPAVECARPLGSGAQAADAALFDRIDTLIATATAADSIAAARMLVADGLVAGHGTSENRAQRLARRWREHRGVRIISPAGGESGSIADMSTHAATPAAQPDLAARVAALEALCAEMQAERAELRARDAERQAMAAENEAIVAKLIEGVSELHESSGRTADAIERFWNGVEDRLNRAAGRTH